MYVVLDSVVVVSHLVMESFVFCLSVNVMGSELCI